MISEIAELEKRLKELKEKEKEGDWKMKIDLTDDEQEKTLSNQLKRLKKMEKELRECWGDWKMSCEYCGHKKSFIDTLGIEHCSNCFSPLNMEIGDWMKRCKKCDSLLLSLYYRDNQKNHRNWVKTKYRYCKKCKK